MVDPGYVEVAGPSRVLEVLTGGAEVGVPLLCHSGSPSAAVPSAAFDTAAADAGLRLITYSRPGYGGSTARPAGSGRPAMVDDVADMVAVLDATGAGDFVTLGWSGGGPRALAAAAVLAPRCLAAATLAGVAPFDGDGLDWAAGMAPENQAEYAAAAAGPEAYAAYLTESFLPVRDVGPDDLAAALGDLLTPVDVAALTGDLAGYLARSFHRAAAQGVVGTRDDGLAAVAPWGFDPGSITVPVSVWQGDQDAMVPVAHGRWLAAHVPTATARFDEGGGHLSMVVRLPEILADLRTRAGLDPA